MLNKKKQKKKKKQQINKNADKNFQFQTLIT